MQATPSFFEQLTTNCLRAINSQLREHAASAGLPAMAPHQQPDVLGPPVPALHDSADSPLPAGAAAPHSSAAPPPGRCVLACSNNATARRNPESLIPGLPDDVALMIFARVPYALRRRPCQVSKTWLRAMYSSSLYEVRKQQGLLDSLLCIPLDLRRTNRGAGGLYLQLNAFDKDLKLWCKLPPLPWELFISDGPKSPPHRGLDPPTCRSVACLNEAWTNMGSGFPTSRCPRMLIKL